jgi:trk system potassium uptake protein TrkH
MHWQFILKTTGTIVMTLSLLQGISGLLGFYFEEGIAIKVLWSSALGLGLGGVVFFLPAKPQQALSHREAYVLVSISWISSCLIGALPYLFTGVIPSFTDAFFESTSGFTTTGATVLTGLEQMPRSILFWRALTQWLGGMGIIVLSVAILPFLGIGGMEIYKAEVPSPVVDKLRPRIRDTAKALWKVYVIISLAEFILLLIAGLSPFDAICHTFTTLPTGGFSTMDSSVGGFKNPLVDFVIILFMLFAGINFSIHYQLLNRNFEVIKSDSELRWFLMIVCISCCLILPGVLGKYNSFFESLRHSLFQVVSIVTTTGYVTTDYEKWPDYTKFVLLALMFIGAMAGSTGGAIKVMRVMLLIKHGARELGRLLHPHAVMVCKIGKRPIQEGVVSSVLGFYVLYMIIFGLGTMVVSITGLDFLSSIGAMASCLGNVGPGFAVVGPMFTYKDLSDAAKWVLSMAMLMGRLEIFTLLVTMTPFFWKE